MIALFHRLMLRPLWSDRARTLLTLLSITVGVAVIFAMDLAGEAAAGSFRSSMETVNGPDDIEIQAVGGVDAKLLATLNTLPFPLFYAPRIEDYAIVNGGRSVPMVGVDVVANALRVETKPNEQAPAQLGDRGVFISGGLGRVGDRLKLQVNDQVHELAVLGVIDSQQLSGDVVVLDLEDAETITGRAGRLDRILVSLPADAKDAVDEWVEKLRPHLPSGVTIRPIGARKDENRKMLAAFRWNLRILSYIALLVGAFLIYNTISVSVVRRRGEIGILRALGASRTAVRWAFLAEAAFFGLLGGALGLLMGRFLAEGMVKLVALTVQALYVSSTAAPVTFDPAAALAALATAILVSVLAALAPALEAGQVPPTEAMARGRIDTLLRESTGRKLLFATLAALAAALLSQVPPVGNKPIGGYVSALLLVVAASLAAPMIVRMGSKLLGRIGGITGLLATRSLAGALRRTSVLVAALATAVAMMTSVGIMVGSFRETMLIWLDSQIRADFYLRPAGEAAMDRHPTIAESVADAIEKIPGVAAVDRFRAYSIRYNGLPVTLAAGDVRAQMRYNRTELKAGDKNDAIRGMLAGEACIVSEPFSEKHRVRLGDRVTIPLGGAQATFRIAGIYLDYTSENGYIILDQSTLRKFLPADEPSNLAVYVAPNADRAAVRRDMEKAFERRRIAVFENSSIRAEAIRIFDQTFAVTYALEGIAIFVAVVGVAGAMLALIIDRRREIGLLRFLGASRQQIRGLVLHEAGLIGLFSQIIGVVCGFVMSLVLIFVINKQSFGWTIQFHLPVAAMLGALAFVYICTVLAGLYPARVATNLNPIEVMHEE
jgi:putative ABC transport system permease protein